MTTLPNNSSFTTHLVYILYRLAWFFGMPLILAYLYKRGRKDPAYWSHLPERFGLHRPKRVQHVWIHAVSLGELRSAAPLINRLLEQGEQIVTTHFTPAGRTAAHNLFPDAIAQGRLTPVYVPFDYGLAYLRFFKAFQPKYGLVMEIEFWPGMIRMAKWRGIPLLLCNGQYSQRAFDRDKGKLLSRGRFVSGFHSVMVKSQGHAERFQQRGVENIEITGEMRFEQDIPQRLLDAANKFANNLPQHRPVITLASVVYDEEDRMIDILGDTLNHFTADDPNKPLFIFVPRAPERFDIVAHKLKGAGINYARRSGILNDQLSGDFPADCDILLGDSLGEMYFYLNLCQLAIVGGGFGELGSHNISEPLTLGKPTIIGHGDFFIEFLSHEAIAQGVVKKMSYDDLQDFLRQGLYQFSSPADIKSYCDALSGATERTLNTLNKRVGTAYDT